MSEKRHVLIVEDDDVIRGFLADSLEMQGYAPTQVSDGEAALAHLETEPVDLVVSDVKMPGLDGIELSKAVRAKLPDVPVILITGVHADERDRILDESGATACLAKPLRIQQLCEVLERACPPA